MSVETLRRAAALMRERAQAATPGPWAIDTSAGFSYSVRTGGTAFAVPATGKPIADAALDEDAQHIASWHPGVAPAVADWLDSVADDVEADPAAATSCGCVASDSYHRAEQVACLFLREVSQ